MLPAKIGDGVFGSSCGGVNPTGASSFTAAEDAEDSVFSARIAVKERDFGRWVVEKRLSFFTVVMAGLKIPAACAAIFFFLFLLK